MRKKALVFDMDGVIIDSEGISLHSVHEFLRSINPSINKTDLLQIVGRSRDDVWRRIANISQSGISADVLRMRYREEWLQAHPKVIDYKNIFRPETIEVLCFAREQGLKTAVASSTQFDLVMKILTELEVDKYLDLVVSGEFFERSKPDPAIYINTCKRLNVAPQDVLVIEDSTVGIRAAHDAGVEVAALIDDRYGFDRSLADHEIASILELKKLIDVS